MADHTARPSERDAHLWAALLSDDPDQRCEAARTIRALEQEREMAYRLLAALTGLTPPQRLNAGESLSLLGDVRFSPPLYLSEMIAVPGGPAVLGSDDYPNEHPAHSVDVQSFSLAQYPVTQMAYAVFVEAAGYHPPRGWGRSGPDEAHRNAPVVHVSARDAEAYCRWLSAETGQHYRLPTEAEWVLAARGIESRRTYPWGDAFDERCANVWPRRGETRLGAVGLFTEGRGPYEHDDMAGNVWEWCSSLYWPYPYRGGDGREDSSSDEPRVMHGGSWRSRPLSARCAARQGERPTDSFDVVGFRLARDL